jgi:hypothetical protein
VYLQKIHGNAKHQSSDGEVLEVFNPIDISRSMLGKFENVAREVGEKYRRPKEF